MCFEIQECSKGSLYEGPIEMQSMLRYVPHTVWIQC